MADKGRVSQKAVFGKGGNEGFGSGSAGFGRW